MWTRFWPRSGVLGLLRMRSGSGHAAASPAVKSRHQGPVCTWAHEQKLRCRCTVAPDGHVGEARACTGHRATSPVTVPRALLNGFSFFIMRAHFVALHNIKLFSTHGLAAI